MADSIRKKEQELYALQAKAVTKSQVQRFEENSGRTWKAKKKTGRSPHQPSPSPRQIVVTTSQDSQDQHIQDTDRQDSPWKLGECRPRNLMIRTDCDDDRDDFSMDSSANSTTSLEHRNGPFVYASNGHEEGIISPLSGGGEWSATSPHICGDTTKGNARKSPRTKIPEKRLTPSNSSVPSALLGVVFETVEEELVFEVVSDDGDSEHTNNNKRSTPAKYRCNTDSSSDEPLFFHDIPLTPSVDLERQQETPRQQNLKHKSPRRRPGIFSFEQHPKLVQSDSNENISERSKSLSRSSWRYLGNLLQWNSPGARYETMTIDTPRAEECDKEKADDNIQVDTMTTLTAEPEAVVLIENSTCICKKVLRASCCAFFITVILGIGMVGLLLLTTNVLALPFIATKTVPTLSAKNETTPPDHDVFLTVAGSLSGFKVLNDHSSPAYNAYRWMAYKDRSQIESAKYSDIVERYIAVLLYFATNGSQWNNQLKFLSETSICEWNEILKVATTGKMMFHGIRCNGEGRVMRIDLPRNNMTGALPWELAGLESLEVVRAPHNRLVGSLPTQLGLLADLRVVDLANNHITGTLPTEIGWLGRAQQIKLRMNRLDGTLPETINEMSNLIHFDISSNHLTGNLPSDLGQLKFLEYFDVSHNNLEGSVPVTFSSRNYTILDVSFNDMAGNLDADFCLNPETPPRIWADCLAEDATIQCSCCFCCDEDSGCEQPTAPTQGN